VPDFPIPDLVYKQDAGCLKIGVCCEKNIFAAQSEVCYHAEANFLSGKNSV